MKLNLDSTERFSLNETLLSGNAACTVCSQAHYVVYRHTNGLYLSRVFSKDKLSVFWAHQIHGVANGIIQLKYGP